LTFGIAFIVMVQFYTLIGGTQTNGCCEKEFVGHAGEAASSRCSGVLADSIAGSLGLESFAIVRDCFPSEEKQRRAPSRKSTRFIADVFHLCVAPNKAPEPTPTAVTPRACARVAPAAVVAHL
jgi:hypothetical protein